jgi:CRP/FNR family transcriptional regulator
VNGAFEIGGHGDPLDAEPAARHRITSVVRLQPLRPVTVAHPSAVRCSKCRLLAECLPAELERELLDRVDDRLVSTRIKVAQGAALFRAGDRFDAVFAIWTGFFKTLLTTRQGREQVTGFQTAGDLVGLDGIHADRHAVDAIALEDSQVCVIPFAGLQVLAREAPTLQQRLNRLMSREIVNNHGAMLHLGSMYAEERLAAFLLHLAARLEMRGYSGSSLLLRMSRSELGSYLGLKPETVSRMLSRFQARGLLHVSQRQVRITDPDGLRQVLDGARV